MDQPEYSRAFVDALAAEIKAEMGRKGVRSIRHLAELTGMKHQNLNDRLNGATHTKRKTAMTGPELIFIERALGVEPMELMGRAMRVVEEQTKDRDEGHSDSA